MNDEQLIRTLIRAWETHEHHSFPDRSAREAAAATGLAARS